MNSSVAGGLTASLRPGGMSSRILTPASGGSVTQLIFHVQPDGAVAGSQFTQQPVVYAADAGGNPVFGYNNFVVISINTGAGTLSGTKMVLAVNGVVTYTDLSIDTAGPFTLNATNGDVSVVSASFTVASTLLTNLISYWTMDQVSGTRNDSTATANNLADNNGVTSVTGIIDLAAQFTAASSQYLSHASNASLQVGDIDFTFGLWAKFDSLGTYRMLLSKLDNTNGTEYLIYFDPASSRISFLVSHDGTTQIQVAATSFGAPTTGVWYYILAWHDSGLDTINISINDGTVDSAGFANGVFVGTVPFFIGAFNPTLPSLFQNGPIDEVGFWKRLLTSGERTSLYNAGAGLTYPFS